MTYPLPAAGNQIVVDRVGIEQLIQQEAVNIARAEQISHSIQARMTQAQGTWSGTSAEAFQNASVRTLNILRSAIEKAAGNKRALENITDELLTTDGQIAAQFG